MQRKETSAFNNLNNKYAQLGLRYHKIESSQCDLAQDEKPPKCLQTFTPTNPP